MQIDNEKYQLQKNDCIKRLFEPDGLLYDSLCMLPEDKRIGFVKNFVSIDKVQNAVDNFFCSMNRQYKIAAEPIEHVQVNNVSDDVLSSANDGVVISSADDNLSTLDSVSTEQASKPLDIAISAMSDIVNLDNDSIVPMVQHTQNHSNTLENASLLQSAQLKPGEIPATVATTPKLTPVPEASKTSFTMSANGKANEEYRGKIQGRNTNGKCALIRQVDIPADLGLSFDAETCEVFGTPMQAGEFELKVHFQFEPCLPSDPTPVGTCQLIVNPDPKTLWKNLDSDRSDKYWKEDADTVFLLGNDGLAMIVASKRGRSHAHAGTFRDDDFKVEQDVLSGWRIMTVADGAGSAKKSREGSKIATRIANESVLKGLKGERGDKLKEALVAYNSDPSKGDRPVKEELYYLFGNAAREAVHAINTVATIEGVPFKEFSTTLIITVHKKFEFGHFVGAYWVGDGGAGIYLEGQDLTVLGKADSGEFAGQTRFLDFAMVEPTEIMNRIRFKVVKDFTAVLAMTDGITDPKFETDANIENSQMWDVLWSELEPITTAAKPNEALLDWLDFWSAGNHDDRTIGILCPIKPRNSLQQGATDE